MPQVPFSETGVQQKQAALYDLSDELLTAEADLIKTNLRQWLSDNFSFTTAQAAYLAGIDDRWIEGLSGALSFSVRNRNHVFLSYEGTLPSSKVVRYEDRVKPRYAPATGFSIEGSLEIVFSEP